MVTIYFTGSPDKAPNVKYAEEAMVGKREIELFQFYDKYRVRTLGSSLPKSGDVVVISPSHDRDCHMKVVA